MKRIVMALLKIFAAFLIALAVWYPFGGIMWRSESHSSTGTETPLQPAGHSHLGSLAFIILFAVAVYLLFRQRHRKNHA